MFDGFENCWLLSRLVKGRDSWCVVILGHLRLQFVIYLYWLMLTSGIDYPSTVVPSMDVMVTRFCQVGKIP